MRSSRSKRIGRRSVGAALAVSLAWGAWAACGSDGPPASRPNVVLVVVDTLRRDHVGAYGYPRGTTPSIDRLAESSVRYDRAISQAPWTTPSIGALFTSRYPTTLGIEDDRSVLREDLVLLPEVLREHGYRTGAVISHSFCSAEWNFDQGFEAFDETQILGPAGISSPEVTRRGLEFVDRDRAGDPDQPFFLWLHYFDPHWRYVPHPSFELPRDAPYQGPIVYGVPMRMLREMAAQMTPEDIGELLRQYDSEIAFTDHHIGRFLDGLRERGLFDDALIVFLADHGEEFLDHGTLGHAHSLFGEVIDVPLLIHYPGVGPGVVDHPVATVDVYPTILSVLGIEVSHPLVGRSLHPPDEARRGRPVFSETSRRANLRAVVVDDLKLVWDLETGTHALYDLGADPSEARDVHAEREADAAELRALLEAWRADVAATAGEPLRIDLSPEEQERLRAIGYGGEE